MSARIPRLTVVHGSSAGTNFDLYPGRSMVGRDPHANIVLGGDGGSRWHASIDRSGDRVTVTDLGTRNGTRVNQQPLRGDRVLTEGDVVEIGGVMLRYSTAAAPARYRYDFGGVRGGVQTGSGVQYNVGRGSVVHGDQYQRSDYYVDVTNDYDPWDEVFQGSGPGRALAILGGFVALAGFGIWMYLIIGVGWRSVSEGPGAPSPFEVELFGVPAALVGFGMFVLGGVLAGIGNGMSKAARKRAQRHGRRYP